MDDSVRVCRSAFGGKIVSYQVNSDLETLNVEDYIQSIKSKSVQLLEQQVLKHTAIKANVELFALYILPTKEMRDIKSHNTANKILTRSSDIDREFDAFLAILNEKSKEFAERESGWVLEKILYLEININKYNPLRASSYIPLPKDIANKKAIVNIQNTDVHCFAWAIVAGLYTPNGRVCDMSSYPHYSKVPFLNFSSTEFPVALKAIPQWELENKISINVYGLEPLLVDGQWKHHVVGPLHYTTKKQTVHLNLLLIDDSEGNQHYCWIKNFSRLLSRQMSANHRVKHFCDGCLQYFDSETALKRHVQENCKLIVVKLPTREPRVDRLGNTVPDDILKFENYHKQLKVPFCVYADFECILSPLDQSEPSNQESFTIKKYQHIPCSFAYLIKAAHDDAASKFYKYRGENAADEFVNCLQNDMRQLYKKYLKAVTPMSMSQQDVSQYDSATVCYICDKPFEPLNRKVRDHCHITGKYRGAAHSICNLNHKLPKYIPITSITLNFTTPSIFIIVRS
ncbi:unnamed protein product [Callosobruchus maculatus]|uniref:C2H2-type domain-containing protein n=1 Tax=Callosobruchus maculatus TaxID=64391 RepID=A0A653DR93_CALMS|nr:unnamed protein product [Callosobruchus maculatus]